MQCRKCEKEIPDSAVHCAYCGTPTSGDIPAAESVRVSNTVLPTSPARGGKRFVNYFVDWFLIRVIASFVSVFGLSYTSGWFISWLVVPFVYYVLFETLWSKTPAKFLTKTRVVTDERNKPDFSHIAIRTLVRFVPFEPLSFFFPSKAGRFVGWHDRWAHTVVIDDK